MSARSCSLPCGWETELFAFLEGKGGGREARGWGSAPQTQERWSEAGWARLVVNVAVVVVEDVEGSSSTQQQAAAENWPEIAWTASTARARLVRESDRNRSGASRWLRWRLVRRAGCCCHAVAEKKEKGDEKKSCWC